MASNELEPFVPASGIAPEILDEMQDDNAEADVGVIMGSDSDLEVMAHTMIALAELKISFEPDIVSAHRTPEWMQYYGHRIALRGLKVVIAGAGGSAHLPGNIASLTHRPIIGVAIDKDGDPMKAAQGSMIAMPQDGGPLLYAGDGQRGAVNAAVLAGRILGLSDEGIEKNVIKRMKSKSAGVLEKSRIIRSIGPAHLLRKRGYEDLAEQVDRAIEQNYP